MTAAVYRMAYYSSSMVLTVYLSSALSLLTIIPGCVAPNVIQSPEGQDVLLPCPHQNLDVYLIQWRRVRDGGDLKHLAEINPRGGRSAVSARYNITANLDLAITLIANNDSGTYQCEVSYKGTSSRPRINNTVLNVYEHEVRNVQLGENVILQCSIPKPNVEVKSIYWARQRDQQHLVHWTPQQLDSTYNMAEEYNLALRDFSSLDVGVYWCNVTSSENITYIAHKVIVTTTEASDKTIKARVGESVRLACPVSRASRTHGEANWTRYSYDMLQATLITTVPRYSVRGDFLTIENASPNDDGVFVCQRPQTERAAGVVHTIDFHTFAIPTSSPHIDGCGSDGMECEQEIAGRTNAFFTCRVDNIYPEVYPTWGEEKEYREKIMNSDGTFNTSCSVVVNGADTPTERRCYFFLASFNESTKMIIREVQHGWIDSGWIVSIFLGIICLALVCALVVTNMPKTSSCTAGCCQFVDERPTEDEDNSDGRFPSVSNGTTSGGGHRHPDGQMNGFQMDTIIGRRTQSCQIFTDNGGQTDVSNGTTSGGGHRRPDGQTNGFLMNSTI